MCKMSFKVSAAPAGGRAGRAADLQRRGRHLRLPGAAAGPQEGVGAAPRWAAGTGRKRPGRAAPVVCDLGARALRERLCALLAAGAVSRAAGRRAAGTVAGVTGGRGRGRSPESALLAGTRAAAPIPASVFPNASRPTAAPSRNTFSTLELRDQRRASCN
uniref:Uncharacterized protein n=1 Tax=Rangifer tarandus platyrhynchus TaxID=3082113 RepID=A0ACB0ENF3_RANTA|nr:unnamed protein product [Rangifer tarandus platyrhynchus]